MHLVSVFEQVEALHTFSTLNNAVSMTKKGPKDNVSYYCHVQCSIFIYYSYFNRMYLYNSLGQLCYRQFKIIFLLPMVHIALI